MAWRRAGDKPLPEPIETSFPTHLYVPQSLNEVSCLSCQTPAIKIDGRIPRDLLDFMS